MKLMSSNQQIFQIDYPLPKVDLLAVHEFVSLDLILPEQSTFELVSTNLPPILVSKERPADRDTLVAWRYGGVSFNTSSGRS